jgi:hypothetical protein
MAFPKGSISLDAAKAAYPGVEFFKVEVGGETVAYRAKFKGYEYENKGLTKLCAAIWLANAG